MKAFAMFACMLLVATVCFAGHATHRHETVEVSYSASSSGSYAKARTVTRHRGTAGSSGTYSMTMQKTIMRSSSQSSGN